MKKFITAISLCLYLFTPGLAQEGLVRIEPSSANGDQQIKVIYDATLGANALVGAAKVYMHSGVITDSPAGTEWQYVVGDWGQDNGVGQMTPVDGETDLWEITLSPTARDYYSVPGGTNIFRLSMVFRNADGSLKGAGTPGSYSWGSVASNGDIFVNLAVGAYVRITAPNDTDLFIDNGETVEFSATASSAVTNMTLAIDEGSGFNVVQTVSSGTTINYLYSPVNSGDVDVRVNATIDAEEESVTQTYSINVIPATVEAPLPDGLQKGINYTSSTSATLVLEAPNKDFVYVVGDFNNWQTSNSYLMKRDPATGYYWYELTGLTSGTKYVFQYWIDGVIRVGDPYADEVADPDDDPSIPASVFPDIAPYNQPYGPATVLQTGQTEFSWAASENSWTPPAKEDLMVYELLIRDFLGTHSYDDLIDTLGYIKRMGINAIELMPVMEFEGNISWGYNPSYFFAVDKYYGTKNDFKRFVQAAHAEGIAVIMDMVLNHAFGENPMVRMYFANNAPTAESPWFNTVARHPFNVGYDFNHESPYTQAFVDSVNNYWISEYHVDGFRFDLSKGFTQVNTGADVGAWSAYDASRIAILKRMANEIWNDHPDAYVILEHFGSSQEEGELAAEGMLPWRNIHGSAIESLKGSQGDLSGANATTHVSYMESHDEERILHEAYGQGGTVGAYSTLDSVILLERFKMNAAFFFMLKGPKMIWQFGELGYDYFLNGPNNVNRLDPKPLPWGSGNLGYYEDPLRQYVYDVYSGILNLRNEYAEQIRTAQYTVDVNGPDRQIVIDGSVNDFVIIGNFDLSPITMNAAFTSTGTWYDYFSGDEYEVTSASQSVTLQPGEFHIYTNQRLSNGFENAVETFQVPVTVTPDPFTKDSEITIRFDAKKANSAGTAGLPGASKVFMYSGVVKESGASKQLSNVINDARAEMTPVAGETDVWEITLTPADYYGLDAAEIIFRLGMYFRNENGTRLGKGFRGSDIYLSVLADGDPITISPVEFSQDDAITITYDARFGSGGLASADKVYMHSGVVLTDKATPTGSDWTKVVGEWGVDNGVGQMTPVAGEPGKWRITLTPKSYYSLTGNQQAYWLAMVFRNADGSVKSALEAGQYEGYFVAGNGDIYFDVPVTETVVGIEDEQNDHTWIYPNPAKDLVRIHVKDRSISGVMISDLQGRTMLYQEISRSAGTTLDVSTLKSGVYLVTITDDYGSIIVRKLSIAR